MSSFADRVDELSALVGHGDLVGKVTIDQIYAHYQHEGLDFVHHRGGQAKFLTEPLLAGASGYMERIAAVTLVEGEGPEEGMKDAAVDLKGKAAKLTPREFDNLRRSGAVTVTSDGAEVYHRDAEVPRLSEQELRAISKARHAGHHAARKVSEGITAAKRSKNPRTERGTHTPHTDASRTPWPGWKP